jgi:amidase
VGELRRNWFPYTMPFNITGQPSMSVPTYFSASGLPVGVQLTAAPFREDLLIRVGAQIVF